MRILFISDNFPPEVNAPASRTYEHAKRWVAEGDSVTVITCAPNFPQGQVHEGYENRWRSVEVVDGIRVVRVKSYIARNEGFVRRILDYTSFMLSAFFFGLFEKRPDVVIGTSPQFFAALGAWLLSIAKWRPFVFELRDLWPASIVTVGAMEPGLAIRFLEKLELFLYRRARVVVPVTHAFKDDLVSRGIQAEKIHVVRNGVDLDRFTPVDVSDEAKQEYGVAGRFVVGYFGTHGMAHDLDNVLDAARSLQHDSRVAFLLVGDGAEKDRIAERVADEGISNVKLHGSVPKDAMPRLWRACDVSLVHLRDDPVFATVIPSKIFESFGVGKPMIIVQPAGEATEIVLSAGAGDHVPPGDPERLAHAVAALCDDRARLRAYRDASAAAAPRYSRDRLAASMQDVLKTVH